MTDTEREWTDQIVGERMQVDQEFDDKVAASNFTRQQWGLIMTAVEFDIQQPGDADQARLVADMSNVDSILPELDKMDNQASMAAGPGAGGSGGDSGGKASGLFGGIREALGFGDGTKEREQRAAAEELAQMYADDLQQKLESRGKWENVRTAASDHEE